MPHQPGERPEVLIDSIIHQHPGLTRTYSRWMLPPELGEILRVIV